MLQVGNSFITPHPCTPFALRIREHLSCFMYEGTYMDKDGSAAVPSLLTLSSVV